MFYPFLNILDIRRVARKLPKMLTLTIRMAMNASEDIEPLP